MGMSSSSMRISATHGRRIRKPSLPQRNRSASSEVMSDMRPLFARAFVLWIPCLIAITGVFAFAYLATQQNYRQSLNDPQIQMAEDAAVSLAHDYTPANIVPHEKAA